MLIDGECALSLWVVQVHQEAQFQEIVEWNDRKDDSGKLVDDVEASETHPISEPHLVIVEAFALQGQETHEGWIGHTESSHNVRLANTEHDQDDAEHE